MLANCRVHWSLEENCLIWVLRLALDTRLPLAARVAFVEGESCFAGSISTADRLIRTMTNIADVDLVNAVRMASLTPARMLGIMAA